MSDVMSHFLVQGLRPSELANPDELHERLAEIHSDNPQKAALAKIHLDEAYAALAKLAGLGHRLKLSLDDQPAAVQYPKMMYKDSCEPTTVGSSEAEKSLLADGWRDHPDVDLATKPAETISTDKFDDATVQADGLRRKQLEENPLNQAIQHLREEAGSAEIDKAQQAGTQAGEADFFDKKSEQQQHDAAVGK